MSFDLSRCPQTEEEAKAWFFQGIGYAIGGPANNYEAVLSACGLPPGYGPGVVPTAAMPYFAFTNMESGGVSRGRIFLPTAQPDGNNYYTRQIQVIADDPNFVGSLVWAWQYISGHAYAPVQGASGEGGSGEGGNGGSGGGGLTAEQVAAMIDAAIAPLEQQIANAVKLGDKIALRTNSGLLAGIQGGGPTEVDAPIQFIGKDGDPHAWESLTLEKGE